MKKGEILNEKLELANEIWDNLIQRFGVENAHLYDGVLYKIKISCMLCEKYNKEAIKMRCNKCPFYKFDIKGNLGCVEVIKEIIGDNYNNILTITPSGVIWNIYDNKEAIKMLNKLKNKLLEMK